MAKKNKNKKQDSKTTFLGASAQQQENQIKLVTDAFLDFGTKINKDEALQAQIRLIEKDVKEKAEFERTAKKIAIAQEINEKQVVNTTENYSNTTKDNLNNVILQQSTNALEEYSSYQDKSIKEQREGIVVREKEFEQLKEYKLIKQISTEYVNTFLTKVQTEANEQKAAEKLALAEKVQTETLDQKNEEIKNLYTIADKMSQKTKYPNAKGVAESRKKTDMAFFGGSSFICAVSSVAAFFAAPH